MNLEDYIKDLSPELQENARACGSAEELVALARENKLPVPDDALAAIAGGEDAVGGCFAERCPKCDSSNVRIKEKTPGGTIFECKDCGYEWYRSLV